MAWLHTIDPSGIQTDIDLNKLLLTNRHQSLSYGAKFCINTDDDSSATLYLSEPGEDNSPYIRHRVLDLVDGDNESIVRSLDIGFGTTNNWNDEGNGAGLELVYGYENVIGEVTWLPERDGGFELIAMGEDIDDTTRLQGFTDGRLQIWQKKYTGTRNSRLDYDTGNNYIRFGNGLRICWGNATSSATGATITFPVPATGTMFTSAPAVITSVRGGSTNNPSLMFSIHTNAITKTDFKAIGIRLSDDTITAGNYTFDWIAYGVGSGVF